MAIAFEKTGDYRVLRRLPPRRSSSPLAGVPTRLGLFVDVETTGLDPVRAEIIDLAMVPFTYGLDGQIFGMGQPFNQLVALLVGVRIQVVDFTRYGSAAKSRTCGWDKELLI